MGLCKAETQEEGHPGGHSADLIRSCMIGSGGSGVGLGRLLLGFRLACFFPSGRAGCRTCRATACSSLSFSFGYPLTAPVHFTSGSADCPAANRCTNPSVRGHGWGDATSRDPHALGLVRIVSSSIRDDRSRMQQRRLQTDGRVAAAFLETRWNILAAKPVALLN